MMSDTIRTMSKIPRIFAIVIVDPSNLTVGAKKIAGQEVVDLLWRFLNSRFGPMPIRWRQKKSRTSPAMPFLLAGSILSDDNN